MFSFLYSGKRSPVPLGVPRFLDFPQETQAGGRAEQQGAGLKSEGHTASPPLCASCGWDEGAPFIPSGTESLSPDSHAKSGRGVSSSQMA